MYSQVGVCRVNKRQVPTAADCTPTAADCTPTAADCTPIIAQPQINLIKITLVLKGLSKTQFKCTTATPDSPQSAWMNAGRHLKRLCVCVCSYHIATVWWVTDTLTAHLSLTHESFPSHQHVSHGDINIPFAFPWHDIQSPNLGCTKCFQTHFQNSE